MRKAVLSSFSLEGRVIACERSGFLTLPWRGRVGLRCAERNAIRGGVSHGLGSAADEQITPPRRASRVARRSPTLPLQGRVSHRRLAVLTCDSHRRASLVSTSPRDGKPQLRPVLTGNRPALD